MHLPKLKRPKQSRRTPSHRATVVVSNTPSIKEQQKLARREAKLMKGLGKTVEEIESLQAQLEALQAS